MDATPIDRSSAARRWARAEAERAALVRFARGRGLSPQDAEDCVHEAMLRVVERPDLDEERMGALLTTTVARLAIDVHRRAASRVRAVERAASYVRSADDGDPATVVCDRDEARWSARLVEHLPAPQRQALQAKADGRPVKQIAVEMSTTAKAVESLISRARAAARSAMSSGSLAALALVRRLRAVPMNSSAAAATAGAVAVAVLLAGPGVPRPGSDGGPGPQARPRAADAVPAVGLNAAAAASSAATGHQAGTGSAAHGRGAGDNSSGRGRPSRSSAFDESRFTTVGGVKTDVTTPTGTGAGAGARVGTRPSKETDEEKIARCLRYGPTVGWRPETFPLPDEGHACRHEPGSPLWR